MERGLQKLFLVRFCYLTEASTAETAINGDPEVEKNDPRKSEAATEEIILLITYRVPLPWMAPGMAVHHHRGNMSITG